MTQPASICVYCGADSQQAPLITFSYLGREYSICAQHLPILIHQPDKLAGKLPGAERLKGGSHEH